MAGHIIYLNATLPAPPQVVWDVLTDVDNADQVFRSISDSELLTEGPYDVGTTWHEKRTMFGHHGEEELHVVECEAPRKARGRDPARARHRAHVVPAHADGHRRPTTPGSR